MNERNNANQIDNVLPVKKGIKIFNSVFFSNVIVGIISGIALLTIINTDIKPMSTQKILICTFIGICLASLVILGGCATVDQYNRLGYPFKKTEFAIKKHTWCILYILGVIVNLALLLAVPTLVLALLLEFNLFSLPINHSYLIKGGAIALAISCFLHVISTLVCIIIWFKNFNRLLARQRSHRYSKQFIKVAVRGSGSLCELLLGWVLFSGGFTISTLKEYKIIRINNPLSLQLLLATLFSLGLLFVFMSFMGGHPNNQCLKATYPKVSCISKFFHCFFKKKFEPLHMMADIVPTDSLKKSSLLSEEKDVTIVTLENNQILTSSPS